MFFITEVAEPALMKLHENPFTHHIEYPGRLETIEDVAKELKLDFVGDNTTATEDQLLLAHTKEYIDIMATTQTLTKGELRDFPEKHNFEDIYVNNYTYQASLKAAGCGIRAVERVLETGKIGFVGLRPPGHHAGPSEASGFCYFNNVAIAAKHLVETHKDIDRVLIVDWDVHCGQGTQDCVAGDDRIKLVNIFRHEQGTFWPYCERTGIRATNPKFKNTINVPLHTVGFGNWDYLTMMNLIVHPIVKDWKPQFILVSCGFDAAFGDPEGDMKITPLGFAHLTRSLSTIQNDKKPIPMALFFEGGYFLPVVKQSFRRVCEALEGNEQLPAVESHPIHEGLAAIIHRVHEAHREIYPHFDALFKLVEKFKTLPPIEEVDKFLGRQPDVVEKDACVIRTEEYENELKRQLAQIAVKEDPSEEIRKGGCEGERDPFAISIEINSKLEITFEQRDRTILFKIPSGLETIFASTILLSLNPSSVPKTSSTVPNDVHLAVLTDFINTYRKHAIFCNLSIMTICAPK